ncbi:hypothetical protein HanXRQr2_Chr12g0521861 [Helianthus annuus]|uniref:Uncharacterized protein n=1 Tax=Helianthus annuus TaxID=4232 RepID=A0A251SYU6_HELAN|nr:hypothetical protein HanXRQr2_Chr12g0521861 [Helianthus annuus]KAJ0487965.1 hypothetical protein HanHA300_Chr12g0427851 [Helianthus annuus]KAJ0491286.1 hypothetical protein HanIR_Chr12g0562221 [Helianthus annuus]KAJ0503774.1 hypothetical protein HanHA89_Chr12g0452101 [Helianthus annuus]KAJ0673453.1 hypothetical protein HanLR1_Chr12g0429401 [Helianthus annuus]
MKRTKSTRRGNQTLNGLSFRARMEAVTGSVMKHKSFEVKRRSLMIDLHLKHGNCKL